MRKIVHLSDLHFGRVDERLLQPLAERVHALAPHVLVVSGDLTQRARRVQFEAARAFLDRLPKPQVVVPGNHDVPLYNVLARFGWPLAGFKRHITADLSPLYRDEQLVVLGLNSARSLVVKNGRVNRRQLARVRRALCDLPGHMLKVVVTHHPFDLPGPVDERQLIGRADEAMAAFAQCGVDVLLAGHLHASSSHDSAARHPLAGYGALAVAAGTATSTRGRGERNAFNLLALHKDLVEVQRYEWQPEIGTFAATECRRFERVDQGWQLAPPA
ncbi:MAG: metallophosphoesterase [Pseudomonadota bacterium]